jgi:hypothetical protein
MKFQSKLLTGSGLRAQLGSEAQSLSECLSEDGYTTEVEPLGGWCVYVNAEPKTDKVTVAWAISAFLQIVQMDEIDGQEHFLLAITGQDGHKGAAEDWALTHGYRWSEHRGGYVK